jgi:hypothetical protein
MHAFTGRRRAHALKSLEHPGITLAGIDLIEYDTRRIDGIEGISGFHVQTCSSGVGIDKFH